MNKQTRNKKRKILILGLGRFAAGSGVSAAIYFAKKGDEVLVTDLKTAKDLQDNVARLKKFKNVRFHLGKNDPKDIDWADIVVKNPDVRPRTEMHKYAKKLGKPIVNDVTIFFEQCPCLTVGVTGTRGKSTTTAWIGDMLERSKKRAFVGGNITVSPLTFLSKLKKSDVAVVELSSFLLETCGDIGISPRIAVWTNVLNDHLNAYDGMEDYIEAKAQIMRHQRPIDVFIPNLDDHIVETFVSEAPSRVKGFSVSKNVKAVTWTSGGFLKLKKGDRVFNVLKTDQIGLTGEHNLKNALAAIAAASEAGATLPGIRTSLKQFSGVPYRQQIISKKQGIAFVNDTTATTPDAAIAALERFCGPDHAVHWICGGSEKGLDYDPLMSVAKKKRLTIHVLEGTAFVRFSKALKEKGLLFTTNSNLKKAFDRCVQQAQKHDIIMLSPSCASFGMFKNEFDRGDQFNELVKKVKIDKRGSRV